MFKKQRAILSGFLILFIIVAVSCKSKFEKLKASNDNAKKYQAALAFYNKKQYNKALELFETLVQRYRGQAQAEDLYYYYAYANYNLKDYTSARYHFKTFYVYFRLNTNRDKYIQLYTTLCFLSEC